MFKLKNILVLFAVLVFSTANLFSENYIIKSIDIQTDFAIVEGINTKISLVAKDSLGNIADINCVREIKLNNKVFNIVFVDGIAEFEYIFNEKTDLNIQCEGIEASKTIKPIPLWMSIIPPLIAILFALIFKEVFSALFIGLFSGTFIIWIYSGTNVILSIFKAILTIPDTYVLRALFKTEHLSIIIFSMLIGATVQIITKNGGMKAVINILSRRANNPRSGQFVTWLLGLVIFFDDYANTLVVGNTMRPVTDKLKISREKLAYIVDSTAAPVASIAFVTTWIGAELSYIQNSITQLGLNESAYNIFFSSLKYSFYPILTLIFILILIYAGRDYGPMLTAERRAREKGVTAADMEQKLQTDLKEMEVSDHIKPNIYNAIIPIAIIIFGTIAGLFYTGWNPAVWENKSIGFITKISETIGASDSYKALIWGSLGGLISAMFLSLSKKKLGLQNTMDSMINGFKAMLSAIVILILAWSLAALISDLHTAEFITSAIQSANMSPYLLPVLSFVISALMSFSTGTSWGTMAIMYPLVLPATWFLCQETGMDYNASLMLFSHVVSTVIAGSVFGDHCSPISDTTILSSLASSCNHIQHVRTQLPYALTVAVVGLVFGTLPVAYGLSPWIVYPVMIGLLFLVVRFFGKKVEPVKQ